jgi:tRNA threonylcarbamoyladenosine biosynthesis protein TsaB
MAVAWLSDGHGCKEYDEVLILALETSSRAGSVALLDDDSLLSQATLPSDRRSAQSLAPAIDALLRQAGQEPTAVRLVATTIGPGSFTGLRVGVTTAKAWAFAAGCHCIGLDTLDVIACQALLPAAFEGEIHAIFDAQRKELFVARYQWRAGGPERLGETRLVAANQWLASLPAGTVATGSGLNALVERLPEGVIAAPEKCREPQAATVGRLALAEYRRGRRDDLWKLAPAYLRASAAEEKANGRR